MLAHRKVQQLRSKEANSVKAVLLVRWWRDETFTQKLDFFGVGVALSRTYLLKT
jgi:hypothetical protein